MRKLRVYPLPRYLDVLSGFRLWKAFRDSTEEADREFGELALQGANNLERQLEKFVGRISGISSAAANDSRIPGDVVSLHGDES